MNRWRRWKPRNSTLWRISAAFWMLNAAFNAVTACVARTPSVYIALVGVNVFLASLSFFVSCKYRQAESALDTPPPDRRSVTPNLSAADLNAE